MIFGAYFAVHVNMTGHTGGFMNLCKGCMYGTSVHNKLNPKSLTEVDLVGVSDVLPQVMWTSYFLEAQGYQIESSIIYQDNMSTILMEKN